jgi:poly(ADP-ribose) glycohydrolase ARH3
MNYKNLKEKFVDSMLGTAVGDALGKPLEGLSRDEIRSKYGKVEEMLDGRYTDNTQMMIGVAELLLECKGFNARHMANQFVKNY